MTNKEYVIKNMLDDLFNYIIEDGDCAICRIIGCNKYCNNPEAPNTCKETISEWLNKEHTRNLYPIGTAVEVTHSDTTKTLGYYNGEFNGKHCVVICSDNIGKDNNGVPFGSLFCEGDIVKVGGTNA